MNINKIFYVTYQTFPAKTANSRQTISNIDFLVKNNIFVNLIFPLRDKKSSDDINALKEFYGIETSFEVTGIKHNYPFGKLNFFNKLMFHVSHLLWSRKTINKIIRNLETKEVFFTRSDWIFYYLAKNNYKVLFECHSLTKLRKILINKSIKSPESKIIFLNEKLKSDSKIPEIYKNKMKVIQNGFNSEYFSDIDRIKKNPNEIIFTGSLMRHGNKRNFEYILEAFQDERLSNFSLKIIGDEIESINIKNEILHKKIKTEPFMSNKETIENITKATYGLLVNNSSDLHSRIYTSPLKYFEYIKANLKILALDLPAHRSLPFADEISFFEEDNSESFIKAVLNAEKKNNKENQSVDEYSLDNRVKKILSFINS
tara:strand:+ start:3924 stop:5039 length:1116 start_codon:yes stop_codon:yes gene_type:complete